MSTYLINGLEEDQTHKTILGEDVEEDNLTTTKIRITTKLTTIQKTTQKKIETGNLQKIEIEKEGTASFQNQIDVNTIKELNLVRISL